MTTSNNSTCKPDETRRQVFKVIGSGAVAAAIGTPLAREVHAAAPGEPARSLPQNPVNVLEAFPLSDVQLLDGPFLDAQKRNEAYLLRLDADRMLHNFRKNAGLDPKAPIYGGWESVETWAGIRAHGHTLGHYLTAASLQFAANGNAALRSRVEHIVAELKACQEAAGTGLVNAFPDDTAQIENSVQGRKVTGVPWYTLHKVFAGLRDAYWFTGNTMAKDVLVRLSDWAVAVTRSMSDQEFELMLGVEHGGMNEVMADVYTLTNDPRHLALAERFNHKQVLNPLAEGRDTLDGLHSNTQIPKFVGFERLFQLTGKETYGKAAEHFWKTVTSKRAFATGGNGDNEHFFSVATFAEHLGSAKTMETCCSHNMLRLTRLLFERAPTAAHGDYYEKALFNTILASQCPDTGMVTYFQSTRPGYRKLYSTPFDSFWCCTGTGMENHAKYGDSIYFHGTANGPQKDSLYVNLFIASTVNWKAKSISIKQTTAFPQEGKTRLEITAPAPREFTLQIRHPSWAESATVKVNGATAETSSKPGTFIALKRTWKSGDVVEVDLPMTLRTEALPGTTDTVAIVYGPIVLVGALGQNVKAGEDLHINERTIGQVFNDPIEVPVLAGSIAGLTASIRPAGPPLTFRTAGIGRPVDVTLVPYYQLAHQRYNMYWKIQGALPSRP